MESFSTSNFGCGIVHIIDHTVHILWQDVMIFTNGGILLDIPVSSRRVRNNYTWGQVGMGNMGWHLRESGGQIWSILFLYLYGWEDGGGFCNRQNLGICTNLSSHGIRGFFGLEKTPFASPSVKGELHGRGYPFRAFFLHQHCVGQA